MEAEIIKEKEHKKSREKRLNLYFYQLNQSRKNTLAKEDTDHDKR